MTNLREALKAAVTKHCHVNMNWPATAQLDDSHVDAFIADVRAALTAALAAMWRPIETADKPSSELDRSIVRLWDGRCERHGYWDTNAFARKPRPYWHYVDSYAVSDDRAAQPTHWAPLMPPPPRSE